MNKIFLIGNLTRDPERSETPAGIPVCRFAIAVNRPRSANGTQEVDYFNITAWRDLGDRVARYLKKGNKVAVVGSIQMRNYEDKQGIQRTYVDVIAQDVEFLTPKSQNEGDSSSAYGGGSSAGYSAPKKKGGAVEALEAFDDDGDDIPF